MLIVRTNREAVSLLGDFYQFQCRGLELQDSIEVPVVGTKEHLGP